MEFTIKRDSLFKTLQKISGAVERRHTIPILSNILLVAKDDRLSMTATDLEMELVGYIALDTKVFAPGETTVSASKLIDICKTLPEKTEIGFKIEEDRLFLKSGRSRFVLSTLPTAGFPRLNENEGKMEFYLPQKALRNLVNKIYFSMANEDVRYYLNGMSFDISQNAMKLIAADGHRLSLASLSSNNIPKPKVQVIIPRKGVIELLKLLDDTDTEVKIVVGLNHICVETPDVFFTSKLIDTKCPNYMRSLPKTGNNIAIVDRNLLKQALIRVAILSNEKHRGIRLNLEKDLLKLSANNPEQEEAFEELEIGYNGDDLETAFNSNYLLDVCNAISEDQIKIMFSDSGGILIEGLDKKDDNIYAVMPLQI